MTNNNIFLGSGASVTFVPEVDFTFRSSGNVTDSGTTVTLNTENVDTGKFLFVNNLYQGCTLEYYAGGRTANPASSSASGTIGSATVTTAGTLVTAAQAIIENAAITGLGSFASTGAEVHLSPSAHSAAITMAAATGSAANYQQAFITVNIASASGDNTLGICFDANSAAVKSTSDFDEAIVVSISNSSTAIQAATAIQTALSGVNSVSVTRVGAKLTITNTTGGYVGGGDMLAMADNVGAVTDFGTLSDDVNGGVVSLGDATIINAGSSVSGADSLTLSVAGTNPVIAFTTTGAGDVVTSPTSIHRITSNTSTTFTFSPAITTTVSDSADFFVLKRYGAPLPAPATSSVKRLAADNWLGVVDSLTFPENEIENKQVNLMVGGSRNYTYQYKGIETAGATDLGVMANHGAWLYYFFGKATVSATLDATDNAASDIAADTADKFYLNPDRSSTGNHRQAPLFYRSIGTILTPPVSALDDQHTDLDVLTAPTGTATSITNPITYTMTEEDGDNLPSFSLEQSFSKLSSSNTYRTETANEDETENFVRIARGNRVNTLNLTANENEELKMSMNCMVRSIHNLEKTESYEARRGVTAETSFINYDSTNSFREPFFFSDGQIKMFGQSFLKITSFSLAMNNTLTDKRFIGIGSRGVKDAIPAQRTYEMTFSAMVTDDAMYNELVNTSETTDSQVELVFTKGNQEKITLKFSNYFLTSNSWPMPEDKGAVTIEGTIQARSLHTCEVITHWILQG
jgi:hypothetical protein